jgi:hypothetical protein
MEYARTPIGPQARRAIADPLGYVRTAIVAGCALALILAGQPLPL